MAGAGRPRVLRGGRTVASWSHRFEGNRLLVKVTPFERGAFTPELYDRTFDEVGQLLGATAVGIAAGNARTRDHERSKDMLSSATNPPRAP
jgi:hypothetical protein